MRTPLVCILALLCACPAFAADLLLLQNGESMSGNFVRIRDNALTFRTAVAGQMMVPMDTVVTLSTTQNLVISMHDESVHYGKLAAEGGQPVVLPLSGEEPVPISLAEIEEALAIPAPPATAEEQETWRTSVETGVLTKFGNREEAEAAFRIESLRLGNRMRLEMHGESTLSEDGDFDFFHGGARLERAELAGTSPLATLETGRNRDAGIDWRTDLGLGLRHGWDGGRTTTTAEAGLNLGHTRWVSPEPEPSGASAAKDAWDISLRLGLRYERVLFGKTRLLEELALLPALTDPGEFRAGSSTSVVYPVTPRLHLRLALDLEYDSDPAIFGVDNWEGRLGAGLGWSF